MVRATNSRVAFPDVRTTFLRWNREWEKQHEAEPRITVKRIAEEARINITSLQHYVRGDRMPIIEHCLPLARWYDKPVDDVLRAFGYPDTATLIQAVSQNPGMEAQQYVLDMLNAMHSKEWTRTKWRNSTEKQHAEYFLTRDLPLLEKAQAVADQVWAWVTNPNRNVPRARRNTSDQIATLSY